MASKAKATQAKEEEAPEKEAEGAPDSAAAAARSLRCRRQEDDQGRQEARLRHLSTRSTTCMPSEEVSSDQIEDIYAMLNEMGINVVETEEADAETRRRPPTRADDDDEDTGTRSRRGEDEVARHHREERAVRAHRRSRAHVSARDGLGRAAVARGRNRHRQAHRGRPRGDDRRPVRKPAHLPGHHHLARRTERRKSLPARHHRP